MVKLELGVTDLAGTRFAISPMHEVVGSLWQLYAMPGRQPHHGWAARTRSQPGIDHALLRSLVSAHCWTPDFIAPAPASPRPGLADQLAQIRATPPGKVAADVLAAYGRASLPPPLRTLIADPARLRDTVADALAGYWQIAIAPYWPRMRVLLEADLLHRGLQLARDGQEAAFGRLDRRVGWRDGVLTVDIICEWRREIPVGGRGLRLVPSLFTHFPHLPIDTGDPPVLAYPARGGALIWQRPARPPAAAGSLLGQPRARLLAMLDHPASTTDLAGRLGVTPSAVSQHLQVLAATGLVSRARVGRAVLYRRTETGTRLVEPDPGDCDDAGLPGA
jgi:DNA-binding transcriptional ArsR family regulator